MQAEQLRGTIEALHGRIEEKSCFIDKLLTSDIHSQLKLMRMQVPAEDFCVMIDNRPG